MQLGANPIRTTVARVRSVEEFGKLLSRDDLARGADVGGCAGVVTRLRPTGVPDL